MLETFIVLTSVYCDAYVTGGKRMDCRQYAAASRTLPPNTCIMVQYRAIAIKLTINDKGPCSSKKCQKETPHIFKRELDISTGAAKKLKFEGVHKLKFWKVKCQSLMRRHR